MLADKKAPTLWAPIMPIVEKELTYYCAMKVKDQGNRNYRVFIYHVFSVNWRVISKQIVLFTVLHLMS
jgi:hypothetical protein